MKRVRAWTELPAPQDGLTAALRRAFNAPASDDVSEFEALLEKLH